MSEYWISSSNVYPRLHIHHTYQAVKCKTCVQKETCDRFHFCTLCAKWLLRVGSDECILECCSDISCPVVQRSKLKSACQTLKKMIVLDGMFRGAYINTIDDVFTTCLWRHKRAFPVECKENKSPSWCFYINVMRQFTGESVSIKPACFH